MIPTYEQIKPYIEKGLISERTHPDNSDVRIFNYTQSQQFSGVWDDITMQCRGLILNIKTGELMALPFKKFFNYDEHVQKGGKIPLGPPIISEKLDGSLGILYWLDGKAWIATRGSFESEQAVWATEWLRENLSMDIARLIPRNSTFLFEIIYPENRIVVNYDYSGLVLLGMIDWQTEKFSMYHLKGFRNPKTYSVEEAEQIQQSGISNFEGFVFWWPLEGVRVKVKLDEYKRLHRIVTGVSELAIWETLRGGKTLDEFLDKVPDEFSHWVRTVQNSLNARYHMIENQANLEMIMVKQEIENKIGHVDVATRKDWALEIVASATHTSILFDMLDKKDYSQLIWRLIRPTGRVFKTDIDL